MFEHTISVLTFDIAFPETLKEHLGLPGVRVRNLREDKLEDKLEDDPEEDMEDRLLS